MKIVDGDLFFSSGKNLYANGGIVGLNPQLETFGGYDQSLGSFYDKERDDYVSLTADERKELADYMIALWTKYGDV